MTSENAPKKIYLTIKQFSVEYKAFTEKSLRWMKFNDETNGFKSAFLKIGKKVLVDVNEFWECVERVGRRK